jgi:PilZ domain
MGEMDRESDHPPAHRAPRYPIRITMLYRLPGNKQWRQGRTENISRSGVLFRTDHKMSLEAPIDMLLALPVEVAGGRNARVICRGRVVRMEGAPGDDTERAVAATITNYRLAHSQGIDPERL